MNELSMNAMRAAKDNAFKENFIRDSSQTILRIASKSLNRYITTGDDEWSIAMLAYNKAIDTYKAETGEFLPFAAVVIKRALIDYYRSEKKHEREVLTAPTDLAGEGDMESNTEVYNAVNAGSKQADLQSRHQSDIKEEILEINERLTKYGFSFYDIADCSPKEAKTKAECAKAITYILDTLRAAEAVEKTGKIPIKDVVANTDVSKKLLDRYRRYIVMAVIVLNGEYPLLADYLQYVRKEGTG